MRVVSEATTGAVLLERAGELRAVDDALAKAKSGAGSVIVVDGEAGIGKSAIVRAAVERAEAAGMRVAHATGSELEKEYPHGIAVALFEPLLRDPKLRRADLFSGPATIVEPLFATAGGMRGEGSGDPIATIHGLYWLALNATEKAPLLIAVDDAQWADAASIRFIHYLSRRVGEVPVVLVVAFRTGERWSDEAVADQLRADRSATQLRPAPLTETAVGELFRASGQDVERDGLKRACWRATGGNPFFVTELIWELGQRGPESRKDELLHTLVPERIARFIDGRIAALERPAERFAEWVAILDEEATIPRVARLAAIPEERAEEMFRTLTRAAILRVTGPLGFVHPIVRSAVLRLVPDVVSARMHRAAALLLHTESAPLGVIAAHLLEAEPTGDPAVVTILVEAGLQARLRGEPLVAVHQLRRALDEPPAPEQLPELLLELARAEAANRDPAAIDHYRAALEPIADPRRRAELLLELGHAYVETADHSAAADAFRRGIEQLAGRDDELTGRLEAGLIATAWFAMDDKATADRISGRVLADPILGSPHRELAMSIAWRLSITGMARADEMVTLVRRAIAEAPIEQLVTEGQFVELATGVLFSTDDLLEEIDLLNRAIEAVQRAGSYAKVGLYSVAKSWPDYFTGRLADAIADTQAGMRAAEVGWESFYPVACTVQGLAHMERGELAAAGKALSIDPDRWSGRADWGTIPIARGRLFAAQGEPAKAIAELRAAAEFAARLGARNPGPPAWRTWLAVLLTQTGERGEARALANEALEIAQAWGARWPLGTALRAAGIAEGGQRGVTLLREAVELLDESPARLEAARALVDLGAALRRQGSLTEAREILGRGMDLAYRCGALALLERSRAELKAAGARPRRYILSGVDSLTPAESRVAHLATEGRTNREIAQTLFVTPKAVEYHLANAYRKLEIGSRQELPGALRKSA